MASRRNFIATCTGAAMWSAWAPAHAATQTREPSAGEREGPAPRKNEPSAGEREGLAPRKNEPTIALELPRLAETGDSVPLRVRVASPMTETNHVTRIDVMAPRNPEPRVASFHFSPASGTAEVRSRIRLARSQRVTVRAEFNDGRHVEASASVVVTLGACVEDVFG